MTLLKLGLVFLNSYFIIKDNRKEKERYHNQKVMMGWLACCCSYWRLTGPSPHPVWASCRCGGLPVQTPSICSLWTGSQAAITSISAVWKMREWEGLCFPTLRFQSENPALWWGHPGLPGWPAFSENHSSLFLTALHTYPPLSSLLLILKVRCWWD